MLVQNIQQTQPHQAHWPKPGIYQHYKDKLYKVIGVCRHTETLEELVVYQSLYGDYAFWVRPVQMFCGDVEVDGKVMQRFTFIKEQ